MVPLQWTPGCWVEELPSVIWSINTTPNRSTGYTPFFMVYGAEAVLPSDIRHDSPRVAAYVEANNEKAPQGVLDLLDEKRDLAAARSAIYQHDLRHYHSRRVKSRTFQEGDLVLRLIQDQTDNGTNLSKGIMEEFCQREHIRLDVSSVAHPQYNG